MLSRRREHGRDRPRQPRGLLGGEFSNSFVWPRMKILTKGRWLWTRTLGSTLVGEGIDTVTFVSIATLFHVAGFDPSIWLTLVVTNYLWKCGVEAVMTPVIIRLSICSSALSTKTITIITQTLIHSN